MISSSSQTIRLAHFILVLFFIGLFFFRPIETEDIWWHLSAGQWMMQNHAVPQTDVFALNQSSESQWVFVQWLGSVIYYLVYDHFDLTGLKVFRALLFVGIFLLVILRAHRHVPWPWLIFLIIVAANGLSSRAHLRPHVFNLIFIQIYLIVLFHFQKTNQRKWLWILPLCSMVWFNLHFGCFIEGTALISLFLFVNVLQGLNSSGRDSTERNLSLEKAKFLTLALLGHVAAFLVNPYGLKGFLYPFNAIFNPNFVVQKICLDSIIELQPPVYLLTFNGGWWFFTLSAVVLYCIFKSRQMRFLKTLLFICSLALFIFARRASAGFIIVSLYIIIETFIEHPDFGLVLRRRIWSNLAYGLFAFILIIETSYILNLKVYFDSKPVSYLSLKRDPYNPQGCLDFLKKHGYKGAVFNTDMYGGFIRFFSGNEIKPLMDGRQEANPQTYMDFQKAMRNPVAYWSMVQNKYGINLMIIDGASLTYKSVLGYLLTKQKWRVVYIDGSNLIAANKESGVLPESLFDFEESHISIPSQAEKLQTLDIHLPPKSVLQYWRRSFFPDPNFVKDFEEGALLFNLGFTNAGTAKMIEAYEKTKYVRSAHYLSLIKKAYEEIKSKNDSQRSL